MKPNNYLSAEELKNIAPTLAGMEPKNPFRISEHYFDALHDQIMERVADIAETPVLAAIDKKSQHDKTVPVGYFFELHDSIMLAVTGKEQTAPIDLATPVLDSIDKANAPFAVPDNYFEAMHNQIMATISASNNEDSNIEDNLDIPTLRAIKQQSENPFKVPENYFELLHDSLFRKVTQSLPSTTNLADNATPTLDALPKNNPFKVPEGYFEQQHATILQEIKKNVGGRLIKMPEEASKQHNDNKPLPVRRLWNYVAAAAAAVLVFFVGYRIIDTNNNGEKTTLMAEAPQPIPRMEEVMLFFENLPQSDARAYVSTHRDEFDHIIEDAAITNNINLDDLDLNSLGDISPENARQYIQENIGDFDELMEQEKVMGKIDVKDIDLSDFDFSDIEKK